MLRQSATRPDVWLDKFERELGFIVLQTNREMRLFDTHKLSKAELTKQLDEGDRIYGTSNKTTSWDGEILKVEWGPRDTQVTIKMSAIDRIREKAIRARSVAPNAIKEFEADLDALLAEEDNLKNARTAAVTMHKDAFTGIHGEIDGLKSAIDILSNGGPSLDPLPESKS